MGKCLPLSWAASIPILDTINLSSKLNYKFFISPTSTSLLMEKKHKNKIKVNNKIFNDLFVTICSFSKLLHDDDICKEIFSTVVLGLNQEKRLVTCWLHLTQVKGHINLMLQLSKANNLIIYQNHLSNHSPCFKISGNQNQPPDNN